MLTCSFMRSDLPDTAWHGVCNFCFGSCWALLKQLDQTTVQKSYFVEVLLGSLLIHPPAVHNAQNSEWSRALTLGFVSVDQFAYTDVWDVYWGDVH